MSVIIWVCLLSANIAVVILTGARKWVIALSLRIRDFVLSCRGDYLLSVNIWVCPLSAKMAVVILILVGILVVISKDLSLREKFLLGSIIWAHLFSFFNFLWLSCTR